MNKDITLVVLAGGMGSRFGGLKQIEPVGPNGEFIIDYSVYDAIEAGFNKVVFIIKKELYEDFVETIGKRVEPYVKVEYAFQELDKVPEYVNIPDTRQKPLGTAHALYCAKELVNENFAIISADDFYGSDAFKKAADYLKNNDNFCVIGYKIGDTLSETGEVKRGVCMEQDGYLTGVIESTVSKENEIITCTPLDGRDTFTVEKDHPVSMIMFGLNPKIFEAIDARMPEFFKQNENNMDTCEMLLPDILDEMIKNNEVKIRVIPTESKWYGVTYRDDLKLLKNSIQNLIDTGEYDNKLWNENKVKRRLK